VNSFKAPEAPVMKLGVSCQCKYIFFFRSERESESEWKEGQRERERENLKQAPKRGGDQSQLDLATLRS